MQGCVAAAGGASLDPTRFEGAIPAPVVLLVVVRCRLSVILRCRAVLRARARLIVR